MNHLQKYNRPVDGKLDQLHAEHDFLLAVMSAILSGEVSADAQPYVEQTLHETSDELYALEYGELS